MTLRTYPAKLLLFGEYTVLTGSRALAVPLPLWSGRLTRNGQAPDMHLAGLSTYLEDQSLFSDEARQRFRDAVQDGLSFESNIPNGYGVGSSGAVCAAIYEEFLASGEELGNTGTSRQAMAAMESYFHGRSSGMDPLVSLKGMPVLREFDSYHLLPPLSWPAGLMPFLIDSGSMRKTGDLVKAFQALNQDEDFRISCIRPLVQSVDHAISFFIDGHLSAFWEHLELISQLQLQYFSQMIPSMLLPVWQASMNNPDVCLKLCGAGGGGFFLGFAKSEADFIEFKQSCSLKVVPIGTKRL